MARAGILSRRTFVLLHRWAGLAMAAFLATAGLTGSLLAYNFELERVFAPQLFATPRASPPLGLGVLAERAQAQLSQARVIGVTLTQPDQISVYFTPRTDPTTGRPYVLSYTEFFADPWTGRELGRRDRGNLSEGLINLVPFIYELHWTLVLGPIGQWLMGIAALVWAVDCFNGFYLTLPGTFGRFWNRWRRSWQVKSGASLFRLLFDLHRAGGLWLWAMLFIFAWSSVMMNIRQFYEPVMSGLFEYVSPMDAFLRHAKPNPAPRIGWQQAEAIGARLMAEQAHTHHYRAGTALGLAYFPETGAYLYEVRGSRDVFDRAPKGGSTAVMFDGNNGALRDLSQPTGEHLGNTIESWLYALHMARVFGPAYQLAVCLLGLATAMLSITGVYLWLRKRRGRLLSRRRAERR